MSLWDAHTHLSAGSADLCELDLRGLGSEAELRAALTARILVDTRSEWIRGWGWDGVTVPPDVAPERPVFLARSDGHAAWVNGAARRALESDPAKVLLEEEAFDAARGQLPDRSDEERIASVRAQAAELAALGVGGVDDMVETWGPEIYVRLKDAGELPVSVRMWLPEQIAETDAEALARAFGKGDTPLFKRGVSPFLSVAGIKVFLDGSLSARTAALSRPYADAAETAGTLRYDEREAAERIGRWAERGFAVAVHALGDRAVSLALACFARAPRPVAGAHRIEHAQVVARADFPRFASTGVVASLQPGHWRDDARFVSERLGERPDVVAHPLASFARHGAAVVLGSDWPVSSWDPAYILTAATDPGRGDEALDAETATAWYTSAPQ